MQKLVNDLNNTAKMNVLEIYIFKNKANGFLCKNIKTAKLLTEGSAWKKTTFGNLMCGEGMQ
jgi:hypothetical protein